MTLPELPPLPDHDWACNYSFDSVVYNVAEVDAAVEARERILVAEIERLRAECEAMRWPAKPTPAMRDALRTGSRRDVPSDELCAVRYAALMAARSAP